MYCFISAHKPQQALPRNPPATWAGRGGGGKPTADLHLSFHSRAREAGKPTADFHLSFHSNKSTPQPHRHLCNRTPVAVCLSPLIPISKGSHRPSPNFLTPNFSNYPSLQHLQTYPRNTLASKAREIGRMVAELHHSPLPSQCLLQLHPWFCHRRLATCSVFCLPPPPVDHTDLLQPFLPPLITLAQSPIPSDILWESTGPGDK